jgi:hypothetical protein
MFRLLRRPFRKEGAFAVFGVGGSDFYLIQQKKKA